ncbi:MAG: serine hydrolase [Rhodospirillaceae bacterium]|nr:serine hydrolase [Rhodospirillaceae bacterium]
MKLVIAAGVVLVIAALTAAAFYLQNRVYVERYRAVAAAGGAGDVDIYAPTEPVAGHHDGFIPVAAPDERTVPEAALNEARAYAADNASTALLIWHKGKLQSADYWGGTTAATPLNSRSLHKMLGGLVIATAIKNGHIGSIDDPVAKYVTAWAGTDKATMTIRNVLQMSSGLMWFRGGGFYSTASRRYLDPHWDDVLLNDVPLEFPPGSAYDYSDITADVIPHIIQGATGKRYADYLSEAVLKPLRAAGGEIWVNRAGGFPHGGCCLMLPAETWLRIGLMALAQGRVEGRQLLPDGWMDEMLRPSLNNPHFGLMVWLGRPFAQRRLYHRPDSPNNAAPRPGAFHSEPYLADDLYLFDGLNGQIVYIVPSQDLVIVRMGLRPPRSKPEWDNARLPNIVLRGLGIGGPKVEPRRLIEAPQPVAKTFADEARFWTRWATIQDRTPRTLPDWIAPTDTVAGAFVADTPAVDETARTISADALDAAAAYAEKTNSLSLIVWRDGQVQLERYWNGAAPNDRSETYSMAKSVLSLAVGLAVADGAIGSINESASNYLPAWRGTAKETITIRQLLEMSSGVHHQRFNYALAQSPWGLGLRTFLGHDIAGTVLNYPIDDVPGAGFNYNSANSQILLAIVERATGRRYADFVSEKLWKPLGAKDATLWLDRPGGTAKAFSYFVARPRDWLRLGILMADGGRYDGRQIVPPDWIAAMTTPSARNPNYGLHVWVGAPAGGKRFYNRNTPFGVTHSAPYLADDVVFFDGGGGHRVYAVPSRRLVIVRTGAENRPDWDDAVLPNAILGGLR